MDKKLIDILRPTTTFDIIGQTKINSDNKLIKKMIQNKFACSLIFYGPPGTGKTTFAKALANDLELPYYVFNASFDNKEKLMAIISENENREKIIIIIDEIHRMNKRNQDLLLEILDTGKIVIFATTTENPFFVVNPAIRSRTTLIKIEPISNSEMYNYFKKLINNKTIDLTITDEALKKIIQLSEGDLRVAINNFEILLNLFFEQEINVDLIDEILPIASNKSGSYGDDFHDLKSALQKSVRGSDVDASLHYFSRLIEIGDYETLMRRMLIMSYEDIGMANPNVPVRVYTACESFRQIGMPEGIIPLGLAIVEMALSEKSNSAYIATQKSLDDVKKGNVDDIPSYLKDSHYKSAKKLGNGLNYKYPHDYKNDWVEQQYLPDKLKNIKYYVPKTSSAYERKIFELYNKMKNKGE